MAYLPAGVLPCAKYNIHGSCRITYDKKEYEHSDLVIFHGIGFDFNPNNLPDRSKRSPQQRWAYYCRESPVHSSYTATGEPSESRRFLNGLQFNWTMTYKLNSDIENRYYRIVPGRHPGSDQHYFKRSKMAAAVLSNCKEDRLHYIQELQKYMEVDIYGGCGAHCPSGTSCFALLQEKYKFYLSFENSICKDYVTEKLYRNALMHNMLPVVINGGDMSNPTVAPPGCCIKASDFKGAKELAEYIKKVASNSTLYNSSNGTRNMQFKKKHGLMYCVEHVTSSTQTQRQKSIMICTVGMVSRKTVSLTQNHSSYVSTDTILYVTIYLCTLSVCGC